MFVMGQQATSDWVPLTGMLSEGYGVDFCSLLGGFEVQSGLLTELRPN